jgi:hypothetical protein
VNYLTRTNKKRKDDLVILSPRNNIVIRQTALLEMITCIQKSRLKLRVDFKGAVDSHAGSLSQTGSLDIHMSNLEIGFEENFLLVFMLLMILLGLAHSGSSSKGVEHIYSSLSS